MSHFPSKHLNIISGKLLQGDKNSLWDWDSETVRPSCSYCFQTDFQDEVKYKKNASPKDGAYL